MRIFVTLIVALLTQATLAGPSFDDWRFHQTLNHPADERRSVVRSGYLPPELTEIAIDRAAYLLRTDEESTRALRELFDAYREEHLAAWVTFAETLSDASLESDGVYTDAYASVSNSAHNTLRDAWDGALERLWEDARLTLGVGNDDAWSLVRVDRARRSMMRRGVLYRGIVDPIDILWGLDLDPTTLEALRPEVESYIRDADTLLRSRSRLMEALDESYEVFTEERDAEMDGVDPELSPQERYRAWYDAGADARGRALRAAERVVEASERIRERSEAFRAAIAPLLPPELAADERDRTRRAGRWQSAGRFTESSDARYAITRVLAIAERPGDTRFQTPEALEGERRVAVEKILERLEDALAELDERWERAQREDDEAREEGVTPERPWTNAHISTDRRLYILTAPIPEEGRQSPRDDSALGRLEEELDTERAALDRRAIDELRTLLTLRQRAAIARP